MKVCTYDPALDLCRGCGRNLQEIGDWFAMSDDQRRAVMAVLPERLKRFAPASPARAPG